MEDDKHGWRDTGTGVCIVDLLPEAMLIDHRVIPIQDLTLPRKSIMLMANLGEQQSFCLAATKKRMRDLLPPKALAKPADDRSALLWDLLAHTPRAWRGTTALTIVCQRASGLGKRSAEKLAHAICKRVVGSYRDWQAAQPNSKKLPVLLDAVVTAVERGHKDEVIRCWLKDKDMGVKLAGSKFVDLQAATSLP